ncbi:hypothetical protein Tco_1189197 [Tanacetum coccineum]
MEQYMRKTRGDYGSDVTRPTINQDTHFKLKGKFLQELHDNTFSGSEHEDANKHIEKVLEIVDLFHILKVTQDQIMLRAFPVSLTGATSRKSSCFIMGLMFQLDKSWTQIPSKTDADAKIAIQEMAEYSQKGTMEHLQGLEVGCELCKRPHYTKDCPQKEEGKTLEEAYYTQFGAPYQPGGQYRAVEPGFCQRNNGNSLYPDRRPSLE